MSAIKCKSRICVFVLFFFCLADCQDSFFISRRHNNTEYKCVTNSTFALSWITDNLTENSGHVSRYVPPTRSNFDWNIVNDSKTESYYNNTVWSLMSDLNDVILDQRWEDMKLIKTAFDDGYRNVPFAISRENFQIPLSIRTGLEAHIFLCNGSSPPESNCYWLMLQAFRGSKTAIRKCPAGTIPLQIAHPKSPCDVLHFEIEHPKVPHYLSRKKWNHFWIRKHNNSISFIQADGRGTENTIIRYNDPKDVFNVTHVSISSRSEFALWKIHQIDFIFTKQETDPRPFGPPIDVIEGSICISMFVSMCSTCSITLELRKQNREYGKETFTMQQRKWRQLRFLAENIQGNKFILFVSTKGKSSNRFWAIDEVRQCRKQEFRIISLNEKTTCQLMSKEDNIVMFNETTLTTIENKCPENTIGEFCVPCEWIYDNCNRVTVCSKRERSPQRCFCSAGFRHTQCSDECRPGYYGHGCQKKCATKCSGPCNIVDGTCSSCIQEYTGPQCEIKPPIIQSLAATNITTSSVTIHWPKPPPIYDNIDHYIVSYHHVSYKACSTQLSKVPSQNRTVKGTSVILENLIPYSKYNITVYAVTKDMTVPTVYITIHTSPSSNIDNQEIPKIDITPNATSAEIKFSKIRCSKIQGPLIAKMTSSCKNQWCHDRQVIDSNLTREEVSLSNLIPFSDYTLKVKFCTNNKVCGGRETKSFKTKPTVPPMVTDLWVYTKDQNSLSLRWKPPYPPCGVLDNYRIQYYSESYCDVFSTQNETIFDFNRTVCKLWPEYHCIKVTNLSKNTDYCVALVARNKEPYDLGEFKSFEVTTAKEPSEAPYDLSTIWSENDLDLEWKHPNRSNGQIQYFQISLTDLSKNESKTRILNVTEDKYNLTYYYKISGTDLMQPTRYQIAVSAHNGLSGKNITKIVSRPLQLEGDPRTFPSHEKIVLEISFKKPTATALNHSLILLISDQNVPNAKLESLEFKKQRIVSRCRLTTLEDLKIVIGDDNQATNCDQKIKNHPLRPGTVYNVTIVLTDVFEGKTRYKVYSYEFSTRDDAPNSLLPLLSLLVLIPIVVLCLLRKRVRRLFKIASPESEVEEVSFNHQRQSVAVETVPNLFSRKVLLANFEGYIKESIQSGELERQHALILSSRLRGIYETTEGSAYFDYVDMEYTNQHRGTIPKAYIATEIPLPKAVDDFWATIWEENVAYLVLIGNPEKGKFKKYWPEKGEMLKSRKLSVQLAFGETCPTYECRTLILICEKQIRQVTQIHHSYCGLNPQKFVPLFQKLLKFDLDPKSPICIHSSDGVRETGLVLLCDMCLRTAQKEGAVDVLRNLKRLSDHNADLVDNIEHYKLVHSIIWEYFFGLHAEPEENEYMNF